MFQELSHWSLPKLSANLIINSGQNHIFTMSDYFWSKQIIKMPSATELRSSIAVIL